MNSICHVITTISRGGAENQLLVLAREQVLDGNKVSIIPLKGLPELKAEFEQIGCEVVLDLVGRSPIRQIFILRKILSGKTRYVHAHLPRAELICSVSKQQNPFFISRHNAEPFFPGAPKVISNLLSRFVGMRANAGIAISEAVRHFVENRGEFKRNFPIETIYYGFNNSVGPEAMPPEISELPTDDKHFVIGTVARIAPQKDFPTLLKSFKIVSDRFSNAKLLVLGNGPLLSEMQNMCDLLGIQDKVTWLGRKTNVHNYLKCFDVFVLTSMYEGFGLVLLEAMQSKIPIVASNNSAIPEVLGENFPGLVTTKDYFEFADKICELHNQDTREDFLTFQAERLIIFSPSIMANKIRNFYITYA